MEDIQTKPTYVFGVLKASMNFRRTPSPKGTILQVIPKGTKIKINLDDAVGDYFKVIFKSVPGYLKKEFIKLPTKKVEKVEPDATNTSENNG